MPELYVHKHKVESIFQLLGAQENDISRSIAWAIARCPSFLKELLFTAVGWKKDVNDVVIRWQQHDKADGGFTDIEIEAPGELHIIVEAKRGWSLPTQSQLEKYARRINAGNAPLKRLIALSECSHEYAELKLPREIDGVPIEPLSYKDVAVIGKAARQAGTHAEKRLIDELLTYLGGIMTMQQIDSNLVYVVALAGLSIDIAKKNHLYFRRVRGTPKQPPNYIAFRYRVRLQSIHHIEGYEVFTNPHEKIPEIPKPEKAWEPHFLYTLGPAFAPSREVKAGKIKRGTPVWCMLDTLFTCDTISDASDLSQERRKRLE